LLVGGNLPTDKKIIVSVISVALRLRDFYKTHTEASVNMQESAAVWDRQFVLVNVIFFLIFSNISFFYLYPLALKTMGSSDTVIGIVIGIFSAVTVISRPLMGKATAKHGEGTLILFGISTIFIASLFYISARTVGLLVFATRALHGLGFSAFIAGSFSLVAKTFPPSKRAEAYGVVGTALMGASALCPPVGEMLIRRWGFTALYLAAGLAAALAFLIMLSALKAISHPGSEAKSARINYLDLIKDRSLLYVLISTLIFAHCQSTVINFVALFAKSRHAFSGVFFLEAFATAIFFLLVMARKIDRFGKKRSMRICYPVLVAGTALIPAAMGRDMSLLSAVLFGAAMGILFPAHNALAADHGTMEEKPAVMSLFTATYDTGFVTGTMVSGWVAQHTGLAYLFIVTSVVAFAGFLVVVIAPIREKQIERNLMES